MFKTWSGYEACVHACDRWGSIHDRESELFGSTLVRCCTSVDLLTLHCASGGVVRKTKRGAQNGNGQGDSVYLALLLFLYALFAVHTDQSKRFSIN